MSGPREIRLSTTPTPEAIAELCLGDVVYLDGLMYTAREGVYTRALEEKANIPLDLPSKSAANFHCSPAARINADGSAPEDNPFYSGPDDARSKIWSLGLRNPFRLAVRPSTDAMLSLNRTSTA